MRHNQETCETTAWDGRKLVKCGELAVLELQTPVPAFACFDCAVRLAETYALTWRPFPRGRKWRTGSPDAGTHL